MEAEETTRAEPVSCQRLEIPWFATERGTQEVPFAHCYVSPEVLIEDELPPPRCEPFCESDCACT